jgi:hypothetical protein
VVANLSSGSPEYSFAPPQGGLTQLVVNSGEGSLTAADNYISGNPNSYGYGNTLGGQYLNNEATYGAASLVRLLL